MAKQAILKTNAMRILETAGVPYQVHTYEATDGQVDGLTVAKKVNMPPEMLYKTLVTVGASKEHYVFVLCVTDELNLKKAAAAVGEKSIAMIPVAQINALTGYVRGGCSPFGMKKKFKTVVSEDVILRDTVCVSGGKIGIQVEITPEDLMKAADAVYGDIIFD